MSMLDTFSYFATVVAITIAPGPVVLMLMVRAAGNDVRGAAVFGLGYSLGGLLIITAVCFGLSTWLTAVPEVLEYSKYVMIAYILWLARNIWMGGFDMNAECETRPTTLIKSIGAGLMTCLISPYMTILFPLVLPEI